MLHRTHLSGAAICGRLSCAFAQPGFRGDLVVAVYIVPQCHRVDLALWLESLELDEIPSAC